MTILVYYDTNYDYICITYYILAAVATPILRLINFGYIGVLLFWSVQTNHTIEMFQITVFDITVDTINLNVVFEREVPHTTSAYVLRFSRGGRYTIQVGARIDGHYGRPGTAEVQF